MRFILLNISIVAFVLINFTMVAQISPGDLAEVHAHLEGMSNCTKCHLLGEKVADEKCLECHKELKSRIDQQKGYHSSQEVKGKSCVACHSDHQGRSFKIVKFDPLKFNHNLTGYELKGSHAKQECNKCHKSENISEQSIKSKKFTYLGLQTECLSCHSDYHQKTLSSDCLKCHNYDLFKPASNFDHNKSKYPLAGKHNEVECVKCHRIEYVNDKKFQHFTGLQYNTCSSCHKDPHNNNFGQNCIQCHSVESFTLIKGLTDFDHSKTGYMLEGKHIAVNCKSCHKTQSYTDPVKHERCADCHSDYHNKQFMVNNVSPDCSKCHTVKGFQGSLFTIEQHNQCNFQLQGAHLATPCFACHKKTEKWSFRDIGIRCSDCHQDIHTNYIDKKYYPEATCQNCHSVNRWSEINFDHSKTNFQLTGAHVDKSCRSCHFSKDATNAVIQKFSGLSKECYSCHSDKHNRQFELDGITDCQRCHQTSNWKIINFDHNKTRFPLDGKHDNVACEKCHKEKVDGQQKYIQYKFGDFTCATCHS
jgi:hypothetical protein